MALVASSGMDRWLRRQGDSTVARPQHGARFRAHSDRAGQ